VVPVNPWLTETDRAVELYLKRRRRQWDRDAMLGFVFRAARGERETWAVQLEAQIGALRDIAAAHPQRAADAAALIDHLEQLKARG
jgi:hypothetical protein